MNNLATSTDAQPTDGFATIPDTSILALSNSVTSSQLAFGLNRGDTFKIVQTGTTILNYSFPSLTAPTGGEDVSNTIVINHNLGQRPFLIASYLDPLLEASAPISNGSIFEANLNTNLSIISWVISEDNSTINITLKRDFNITSGSVNGESGSLTIEYYLLQSGRN